MHVEEQYQGPVYFALGDFDVGERRVDLGRGVKIVPATSAINLPITLDYIYDDTDPEAEEKRKRLPLAWGRHDRTMRVGAEIVIEPEHFKDHNDQLHAAWFVTSLIRLWANPKVSLVALSFTSFTEMSRGAVERPVFYPLEVGVRHIHLNVRNDDDLDRSAEWIKKHCWDAYDLYLRDPRFRLTFDALSDAHFIQNEGLILVSLIASLEGMFSDAQAEVSLRVSSYVACYMADPGPDRREIQQIVKDLYDKRSKVAHGGKPKHDYKDVYKAFLIVRRVMLRIIEAKRLPTSEELKVALYGG